MAVTRIKKGLDLPLTGAPAQQVADAPACSSVAVMAADFIGMKPRMEVQPGDIVKRGQLLFEDRKAPGVRHCAPAAGKVVAVNRGAKRALQSVVIELNERERAGEVTDEDVVQFAVPDGAPTAEQLKELLLDSGLWTAIRARPYSRVADPSAAPRSLFITAMDSNPHAPEAAAALAGREADFASGCAALAVLAPTTYLCRSPGSSLGDGIEGIRIEEFEGPHPSGVVGTHIHFLDPVNREKVVWHIGYQHVAQVGALLRTGRLDVTRVVALAGPQVTKPQLFRTREGAAIDSIAAGNLAEGDNRVISGSVLNGRTASGEVHGYLGRYANQVSVLLEGTEREFIGWLKPGADKFTTLPTYLYKLLGGKKKVPMNTNTHGSHRAMVPIGLYERVFPLDILPTFLLRSMAVGDVEKAEALGVLELDEEDLALCTVVDPGKEDYGTVLRNTLTTIEAEG